jgi:hypothetical protein
MNPKGHISGSLLQRFRFMSSAELFVLKAFPASPPGFLRLDMQEETP